MTFQGVHPENFSARAGKAHQEKNPDGRVGVLKPLPLGVQAPRGFRSQRPPQGAVWAVAEAFGEVLHKLAGQKESRIEEGHLLSDHGQMLISVPPKYAASPVVGFIKGKSAIYFQ